MKELSIEEKAKAYDKAIEIAKEINNEQQAQPFNVMTRVFLELAESEDEKIRQLLLRFVKYDMSDNYSDDFTPADCVAWLEKQGKNNMGISEATKQELEDSLNKALEKETPESCNKFLDEQGKKIDAIKNFDTEFEKQVSYIIASIINKDYEYTKSFVKWASDGLLNYAKHEIEKQGEQKPIVIIPKFRVGDKIWHKNYKGECMHHIIRIENNNYIGDDNTSISISTADKEYELVEKQGEQKIDPDTLIQQRVDALADIVAEQKPADKIEPKFKVGDWIIFDEHHNSVYKVEKIQDLRYYLRHYTGSSMSVHIDNQLIRLWTIQDVKDGDVLFTSSTASYETFIFKSIDEKGNVKCYFAYDSEDGFREGKYHFIGSATNCKPATKEQRDLLFKKMKEAGYEWDAKNKELKKSEDEPTWSVEDETMLRKAIITIDNVRMDTNFQEYYQGICDWLESLRDRVQPQPKQEWSEEDERIYKSITYSFAHNYPLTVQQQEFVKSLKDRYTWKPSEEQMDALRYVTNFDYGGHKATLVSLYEQLKKLKE